MLVTLEALASTLRPGEDHRDTLRALAETDWRRTTLDLADPGDRSFAARATAAGAALFYSFANFCAIAAHPHVDSVRRVNLMKGRPVDQVGSVSTTPTGSTRSSTGTRYPPGRPASACGR
jgi:hypothetical protein